MAFIKLALKASQHACEILVAELAELGYDTFEENDQGLDAYIVEEEFGQGSVDNLVNKYAALSTISFTTERVEKENWNKQWESNYDPIEVEGKCRVRATFHDFDSAFEYDIVVIPKMSFGTGHHATTYNMLSLEMGHDFTNQSVLDVGTGTGILAIMASKRGASSIECTDIDTWCIENSEENFGLNDLRKVPVHLGTIDQVQLQRTTYQSILANINKNVLLDEIKHYADLLDDQGTLFLSGFYESDITDIKNCAEQYNLSVQKSVIRDNWAALKLSKY